MFIHMFCAEPLIQPSEPTLHASAILSLTSSIPKYGLFNADVTIAGRHVGAVSKISFWIALIAPAPSLSMRPSAFVITACSVNLLPPEAWHCASSVCSIARSVSLSPWRAFTTTYTRRSLSARVLSDVGAKQITEDALLARAHVVVEERAPFASPPPAVPWRIHEDQPSGLSADAEEIQHLRAALSRRELQHNEHGRSLAHSPAVCSCRPSLCARGRH